jgi:hypothetical protein
MIAGLIAYVFQASDNKESGSYHHSWHRGYPEFSLWISLSQVCLWHISIIVYLTLDPPFPVHRLSVEHLPNTLLTHVS